MNKPGGGNKREQGSKSVIDSMTGEFFKVLINLNLDNIRIKQWGRGNFSKEREKIYNKTISDKPHYY